MRIPGKFQFITFSVYNNSTLKLCCHPDVGGICQAKFLLIGRSLLRRDDKF